MLPLLLLLLKQSWFAHSPYLKCCFIFEAFLFMQWQCNKIDCMILSLVFIYWTVDRGEMKSHDL